MPRVDTQKAMTARTKATLPASTRPAMKMRWRRARFCADAEALVTVAACRQRGQGHQLIGTNRCTRSPACTSPV
jgi:hypothetical protein